ncbi:hypothetical protein [Pseudokineococcus marinus]
MTSSRDGSAPDGAGSLEQLLPPRRRGAGATVAVVAVAVLLAAWASPQLLRPSVWDGTGAGVVATFTDAPSRVLTTTLTDTESWTPFTVVDVEDVPGARVVDAWLLTGADAEVAGRGVAEAPTTLDDHLGRVLPASGAGHLPQRLASGGPVALLVLWDVEDCGALVEGTEPVAELRNVVGARTTDTLADFSAPDVALVGAPEGEATALACPRG